MRISLFLILCSIVLQVDAQELNPGPIKKHSHNDYEQPHPFQTAYEHVFESIEADIFLSNEKLLVAHDIAGLKANRTLEELYIRPISKAIKLNKGNIYPDPGKSLQLLVDIKSEAHTTLTSLIHLLKRYPEIIHCPSITIVISGNRPSEDDYSKYPSFIYFDGRPDKDYDEHTLKRIALISDDFHRHSGWDGQNDLPVAEKNKLNQLIKRVHQLHKPIRFWGSPDAPAAWKQLIELGVDYINTDHIEELSAFIHDFKISQIQLHNDSLALMPYNRIIQSAGKVVRYGDPSLENHALDIASLPNDDLVVVEDRYGIATLNITTGKIPDRFTYTEHPDFKKLVSTYSGIKVFTAGNKTFIIWSAAERDGGQAFLLYAEWAGKIKNTRSITLEKKLPANNAIPNDIYVEKANSDLFLYIVLNGNNELWKMRWSDKSVVWKSETGVAPYGITKANGYLYVTNWAGPIASDSTKERAGVPWGLAYTDPKTGATAMGTVSIFRPSDGKPIKELKVGLHPNAILASNDGKYVYVCNGSSDNISVINTQSNTVVETIATGIFNSMNQKEGSTPNGLALSADNNYLYVSNGMDNAVAVIRLRKSTRDHNKYQSQIIGYIPTEAYPAGLLAKKNKLIVANLESSGADVIAPEKNARSIHQQLASVSIIPVPSPTALTDYTKQVLAQNMAGRLEMSLLPPRKNIAPQPVPQRFGEPSVFKHVVYIIKENKTYDQVLGDMPKGRGDSSLCVFGRNITPNVHALADQFGWMDNYYASGKSSAEGHQWTDAAMVSDYVEKNVRAWIRSYPHRQEDALVYNKSGFIWNQALDHGKTVRIYGEACRTIYDEKLKWSDFYTSYQSGAKPSWYNTSTIQRIRSIISPQYPDCDNMVFSDQQRATEFIKEWEIFEQNNNLPRLMILSLPNDHTAGTSPGWPTPNAMVADNDLALGRIIEKITNSKYWDSTVIFVTQDDSQSGWDHISAYRTVGLVISPYSKPGVTTTHYNQTSLVRTIEQILGIPPMNVIDATATPLFDCFEPIKKEIRYTAKPNNIPLDQMNKPLTLLRGKERALALESLNELFNEVDGGKDDAMNRIIWFYTKGNQKYPVIKK